MSEEADEVLKLETDELRQAAVWKEQFCAKQQDKARFFITLLSTEMFVVGLSLNSKPEQTYLFIPCALSFLVCFACAFWAMYDFARVIEPRYFHGRDEGADTKNQKSCNDLVRASRQQARAQNKNLDAIVEDQANHLRKGTRSFAIFNAVFAGALIISRLTWFFPHPGN